MQYHSTVIKAFSITQKTLLFSCRLRKSKKRKWTYISGMIVFVYHSSFSNSLVLPMVPKVTLISGCLCCMKAEALRRADTSCDVKVHFTLQYAIEGTEDKSTSALKVGGLWTPLYAREIKLFSNVQETGWPRSGLGGWENLAFTRALTPNFQPVASKYSDYIIKANVWENRNRGRQWTALTCKAVWRENIIEFIGHIVSKTKWEAGVKEERKEQ